MNKEEAAKYYKIAADNGQINAMNNYALMIDNGEGVKMNKEEAAKYYKIAADKGDINAIYNYGVMLYEGEGVSINKEEAIRYLIFKNADDKSFIKTNIEI